MEYEARASPTIVISSSLALWPHTQPLIATHPTPLAGVHSPRRVGSSRTRRLRCFGDIAPTLTMPSLLAPLLFVRNPLDEAKTTLSSWDNCMAKSYCKWPVIVVIVVAALVAISVITCIARCICCGAECACCCLRCCTCCCSGSGRRGGHKRVKSDPPPAYPASYGAPPPNPYAQAHAAAPPPPRPSMDTRPINQQYRSNAMPTFEPAPSRTERPQFATFDSTRAVVNDDALPAMPTWKEGRDVHVEVEVQPIPEKQGDMELDRLDRNGSVTSASNTGTTTTTTTAAAAAVPGARRSPGPGRSPISQPGGNYRYSPIQHQDAYASESAPLNSMNAYGTPYAQQDDYRRGSPAQNLSPVQGAGAGYAQQHPYGRSPPSHSQAYGTYEQIGQYNHQAPYDQNSRQGPYDPHNQRAPYDSHNQQGPYDQRDYFDEPNHQTYQTTSPSRALPYTDNHNASPSYDNFDRQQTHHMPSHDDFTPSPVQQQQKQEEEEKYSPPEGIPSALMPQRSQTLKSESTALGSSSPSAYPGQRSYTPASDSVGQQQQQQQPYRAFSPVAIGQGQVQTQQYAAVPR